MANIADYKIIKDARFEIRKGGEEVARFNFTLPNNTLFNQKMILQWVFVARGNTSGLTYRWSIKDKTKPDNDNEVVKVRESTISTGRFGSYHEVLSGGLPFAGELQAFASIIGGSGAVFLSDVVLWVQVKV